MKVLSVIIVIGLFVLAVQLSAKFLLRLINEFEKKQSSKNNPYIKYHKSKIKNDNDYQDYLKWLEKEGSGVPVDKVVTPEDARVERKFKSLL